MLSFGLLFLGAWSSSICCWQIRPDPHGFFLHYSPLVGQHWSTWELDSLVLSTLDIRTGVLYNQPFQIWSKQGFVLQHFQRLVSFTSNDHTMEQRTWPAINQMTSTPCLRSLVVLARRPHCYLVLHCHFVIENFAKVFVVIFLVNFESSKDWVFA